MERIFFIPGKPVAQGRYRTNSFLLNLKQLLASGGRIKPKIQTTQYTPDTTTEFKDKVKIAYTKEFKDQMPGEGYWVDIYSLYKPGKADYSKSTGKLLKPGREKLLGIIMRIIKPDCDNLVKAILDALNKLAWHDDSMVVMNRHYKLYYKEEGTIVVIRSLTAFPEFLIKRVDELFNKLGLEVKDVD